MPLELNSQTQMVFRGALIGHYWNVQQIQVVAKDAGLNIGRIGWDSSAGNLVAERPGRGQQAGAGQDARTARAARLSQRRADQAGSGGATDRHPDASTARGRSRA